MSDMVYIVDDDADCRDGLAWLLASRGLSARTWGSAEAFWREFEADASLRNCVVMLLDIRMEPMSGLELFDKLKAENWPWPVLFLTGHGDVSMAVAAVKGGAWDFLEKPFQDNQLVDRIEAAFKEARAAEPDIVARERFQDALLALSNREREVLNEVLQGHYNKNIADNLGITARTVEFHRANIFEKLQVQSAAELGHLMGLYGPKD